MNKKIILPFIFILILTGCSENSSNDANITDTGNSEVISVETDENIDNSSDTENIYTDRTEETHSKKGDANYDVVFPQNEVNRIDIVIDEENWQAMMDDMEGLYGEFGGSSTGDKTEAGLGRPEMGGERPEIALDDEMIAGGEMPEMPESFGDGEMITGGEMAMGGGGNGGGGMEDLESDSSEKPIYVESQVYFEGTQWYNVGIKYKGHSSLKSTWMSGNYKMPFKLDFDEFEDDYEELKNQRFYGFKSLAFSPNFNDDSFLHEKLATETFEKAGLTVSETAFYSVYVDTGDGPVYYGLYTADEVISDTVIEKFGDEEGNLYEAEGQGVTLAPDTYDMITTHFEKKNYEEEADWSDVQELSTVLNSDLRLSDTDTWKDNLEEIFDVDVFLKWLAVNSTIQNWDTYGIMTHNFYLYDNPENGKLTWIPRDNNESFSQGKKGIVSLTASSTSDDRPLIRYLLDDEDYREQYVDYVHDFTNDVLDTDEYTQRINELHELIEPYVIGEDGENEGYTNLKNDSSFINSVSTLLTFIEGRIEAATSLSLDDDWTYNENSQQTGTGGGMGGGERPAGGPGDGVRGVRPN